MRDGNIQAMKPESDVITYWWYSPKHESLLMEWNGKRYIYLGVPFGVIHAMMSAKSLGKFANSEIKPNYEGKAV